MKTLMFIFAAALLIMASSTARAHMTGTDAIDSHGIAVVSIHHAGSGIEKASVEKVYLDSNHFWAANDLKGSQFFASGKSEKGTMLCLDSISRFCVRSY